MAEFISHFFTREEVACKCGCGFDAVSQEVLRPADAYREHYSKPIIPSSVCRCVPHNRKVGGAKASYHLPHVRNKLSNGVMMFESKAMDLPVDDPKAAAKWFSENYPSISFLVYPDFIHIDARKHRYTRYLQS
jgi:hypothetical protein